MDNRGIVVRFSAGARDLYLFHSIQTSSGSDPTTSIFSTASRRVLGPTQPPLQLVLGDLSPGGINHDHSALCSISFVAPFIIVLSIVVRCFVTSAAGTRTVQKHGSSFGSLCSGWTAFITKQITCLANILSLHFGVISGKWGDVQVTAWATKICLDAEAAMLMSPLLGLCHTSITMAATSVILLLATIMLTSLGSGNVWKDFLLTSCQRDTGAPKGGSVQGPATMCWLLLTRNKFIYQVKVILPVCKLEAEWPCGKHGDPSPLPFEISQAPCPVQAFTQTLWS
jgi:hypothetical protein